MAGGNEDHEDSMDDSDQNDEFFDSTDHSECGELDLGDMEYYDNPNEYCPVHENLKDDIRKALAAYPGSEEELGIPSVQIDETKTNFKYISAVVLTFTLKDISEHLLELWDLEDTPAIIMEMDNIHRGEFRAYGHLPKITVRKHSSEGHFIVGEQLKNFALRECRESFILRANESPSVMGSFFASLYGKLKERLSRLSEYCVTCGEILSSGGVLPSICDRDLCMYQYSELHLFDGLSVPRVSPEVLSLLLFAFSNANQSARRRDILMPAPPIKSMADLLMEAKTKRLEKKGEAGDEVEVNGAEEVKKQSSQWNYTVNNATAQRMNSGGLNTTESAAFSVLLENMPCPREILASVSAYHQFRKAWPQMADIVDWLVISNRAYLEMVPRPMNVDFLYTNSQYCFISDTPAKQAQFDKLVADHGGNTRFFFHGSPLENWHSIIRSGLRNMSGTKYQMVGAAYGKGIYLSPFLDFALGYASRMGGSSFSRRHTDSGMVVERPIRSDCTKTSCCETERAEDLSCVALVEVVDCDEAYKEKTDEIFVVEKEEWCSIRMLLLYSQSDINKVYEVVDKSWSKDLIRSGRSRRAAMAAATAQLSTLPPHAQRMAVPAAVRNLAVPPPPQPSHSSYPSGLMSYMMNKLSSWTGAPNTSATLNQTTHSNCPNDGGSNKPKLNKNLKDREFKEEEEGKAATASVATIPTIVNEDSAGSMDSSWTSANATLGSTSSSSMRMDTVEKTWRKYVDEEDNYEDEKEEDEDKPCSSGLQKKEEKAKEERNKMALGDWESTNVRVLRSNTSKDKGMMEMSEGWRSRKENRLKTVKKDDIQLMKKDNLEKDQPKRKRCMSDPTCEVPSKTSSSPSNDKSSTNLTEEDIRIVEMFADSDLGEDNVQVMQVVKGDKKKKKQSMDHLFAMSSDDSDDETQKLPLKSKHRGALPVGGLLSDNHILKRDKKEKRKRVKGKGSATTRTSQSTTASSIYSFPSPLMSYPSHSAHPFYSSTSLPPLLNAPLPLPLSAPIPHSNPIRFHPKLHQSLPPSLDPLGSLPNPLHSFPGSHSFNSLPSSSNQQPSQMDQTGTTSIGSIMNPISSVSSSSLAPISLTHSSLPPMPISSSSSSGSGPIVSIPSAGSANLLQLASLSSGSGSIFQLMGGMFSRRRRRGNSVERDTPIPGDLTAITDGQREQIYRVVRMFRNAGFEERVNRHMNREEKKDEEVVEEKEDEGSNDTNESN